MIKLFRRKQSGPTCGEVMEVLQSYLDGEVEAEQARAVAAHLEACAHCGPEAEVYRQIKVSLRHRAAPVDPAVLAGLEAFGRRLAAGE
ncbi:MAG: zf-HC2 domain-containing protein [Acidimicrobiales bacterium]